MKITKAKLKELLQQAWSAGVDHTANRFGYIAIVNSGIIPCVKPRDYGAQMNEDVKTIMRTIN